LPSLEGKVTELATKCPWCDHVEEVEIESLPEDQEEPDFEQAKAVLEYVAKEQTKQAKTARGA